jgi:hypothetical protein
MLEELVCGFWLALGAYVFWYVVKAKDFQRMTLDDLALTWKLHRHQTGCKSSCIHDLLVRNSEVVGFRCSCGYEFLQRRLITQRPIIAPLPAKLGSFENTGGMMKNFGLTYKNVKNI